MTNGVMRCIGSASELKLKFGRGYQLELQLHSATTTDAVVESLKERSEIPRVSGEEGDERFVIFDEEESQGAGRAMTDDYWSIDTKLAWSQASNAFSVWRNSACRALPSVR